MGIKNLLKFLNEFPDIIVEKDINTYKNKKIAIDISILLYQVVISIRNNGYDLTNSRGEITSHILGLFNKTITLLKRDIIPIFVFDGKPPEIKDKVLDMRKNNRLKAIEKMKNAKTEKERIKYFKRCVNITNDQFEQSQLLLNIMGIPFVVSNEEADSQCAYLSKNNLVDAVCTEDMDILTFGANVLVRNISSFKKTPIEIKLDSILKKLEITYKEFIDFCILLGCDYCNPLDDLDPNIIYKHFKIYKNAEETLQSLKKSGYKVKRYVDINKARSYFNDCKYNECKKSDMILKKPKIKILRNLLVNEYGLIESKVIKKLEFLDNYYDNYKENNVEKLNEIIDL